MRATLLALTIILFIPATVLGAHRPKPQDVYIRFVDVGSGLCAVVRIPGNHFMIYDAGHFQGDHCFRAVQEITKGQMDIDLMILSHSDGDHIGNAPLILENFNVKRIIRTGLTRDTKIWARMNSAVENEVQTGASETNLQTATLTPGTEISLGDAEITLVAGWGEWTLTSLNESERRNAVSIVVRLDFEGKSILFTGDTVGRRKKDSEANDACKDAEKAMVDNASNVTLKADVLQAPHHGANNGNSKCFIEAVKPKFVIFSAGHEYSHPTAKAAQRYIDSGVKTKNMFRTDRGDDGGEKEWTYGRISGCPDKKGDDDIEVVLPKNGKARAAYRVASEEC